jgi:hypothetical protein
MFSNANNSIARDQAQIYLRNARQILSIASAAFDVDILGSTPNEDVCQKPSTEAHRLSCLYKDITNSMDNHSTKQGLDSSWLDSVIEVCV